VLSGLARRVGLRAFRRSLAVTATANEAVRIEAALVATPRRAQIARNELVLAEAGTALSAAPHRLTFRPKRKLVGRPRKAFRVTVVVRAFDAANNDSVVRATVRVKPPKRKAAR
jgi:hypothetical protein